MRPPGTRIALTLSLASLFAAGCQSEGPRPCYADDPVLLTKEAVAGKLDGAHPPRPPAEEPILPPPPPSTLVPDISVVRHSTRN